MSRIPDQYTTPNTLEALLERIKHLEYRLAALEAYIRALPARTFKTNPNLWPEPPYGSPSLQCPVTTAREQMLLKPDFTRLWLNGEWKVEENIESPHTSEDCIRG